MIDRWIKVRCYGSLYYVFCKYINEHGITGPFYTIIDNQTPPSYGISGVLEGCFSWEKMESVEKLNY